MQTLLVEDNAFDELYDCDDAFHDLIMEGASISVLLATVQMVSLQVKRARLLLLLEPGRSVETQAEHRCILKAIHAKMPDVAAEATRTHLRQLTSR